MFKSKKFWTPMETGGGVGKRVCGGGGGRVRNNDIHNKYHKHGKQYNYVRIYIFLHNNCVHV